MGECVMSPYKAFMFAATAIHAFPIVTVVGAIDRDTFLSAITDLLDVCGTKLDELRFMGEVHSSVRDYADFVDALDFTDVNIIYPDWERHGKQAPAKCEYRLLCNCSLLLAFGATDRIQAMARSKKVPCLHYADDGTISTHSNIFNSAGAVE